MKQTFKSGRLNAMAPYFALAVAIILAYKIIPEIDVILGFIKWILSIIKPFFYGFLLAYILNIPCAGIQSILEKEKRAFVRKRKKTLSIFITYLLFLLILFLILRLVIPSIYNSISLFVVNFQTYYDSAQRFIDYINGLNILYLDINIDSIMSSIGDFSIEDLPSSINALSGVSSAILNGFLAFVSSIYILSEKENFKKFLCRMLKAFSSDTACHTVLKYTRGLNKNFRQYIYTQTIDGCIIGTIAAIELYLLGSQYALTLGVMLGILNYIPYFGSVIGSIAAVVVVAFTQNITTALIAAAVLLITQQIDGNFIQPKLMSGSFSLSPLLVIVSITVGGALAGVLGMIAAIPIVAILKDLLEDVITYYERQEPAEADKEKEQTEGF